MAQDLCTGNGRIACAAFAISICNLLSIEVKKIHSVKVEENSIKAGWIFYAPFVESSPDEESDPEATVF